VNATFNDVMLEMIRESGEFPEGMKRVFRRNTEFYQVFGLDDDDAVRLFVLSNGGRKFKPALAVKDPSWVETLATVTCDPKRVFVALHRVLLVPGNDDMHVVDADIVVAMDKPRHIPLIQVKEYKGILKEIGKKTPAADASRVRYFSA